MRQLPSPYFVHRARQAVPIHALAAQDFARWRKAAPAPQRAWVAAQRFTPEEGRTLLLPDGRGGLSGVLLILGPDRAAPWSWAGLPAVLPAGAYRLAAPLAGDEALAACLGWALAQYRFDRYAAAPAGMPCKLVLPSNVDAAELTRLIEATTLVRDLVNTPANDMGPSALEAAARAIARRHRAKITVTTGEALLAAGFPAIHAVGRAAAEAPRLIDLRWGARTAPKLSLVGKGVCFDTGGLDLKTASGMRLMKKDMGGAAHALALAHLVMDARLPVRLRLLIPAVENAVDGKAYRPGDVIATRKGLRVEIGNTDAEGRVVLGDALALADEEAPDLLIDYATLTGAARVALGPDLPALFTDDEDLAASLAATGQAVADPLWRLPLWMPYGEDLKSAIADLLNAADTPFAGAITAALYLKRFVEKAKSWAHLDIYAWNPGNRPGRPKGGEAMALRAVYALLKARFGAAES
ncbi:MAG: leucyl aminopeptidase family protein [Pseudomonadota bacterium]